MSQHKIENIILTRRCTIHFTLGTYRNRALLFRVVNIDAMESGNRKHPSVPIRGPLQNTNNFQLHTKF